MSVFALGSVIKNRREELGLTQEDLADGICSVPTLSRIENGERMPTKNHFEMLMQRLGYSSMSIDFYTDKKDFYIHEEKFKIRQTFVAKQFSVAKKHLSRLTEMVTSPGPNDLQFMFLYETLLNPDSYSISQKLERYEQALLLTCPKYQMCHLPHVLSYEEIVLLNNIAICHDISGNCDSAISIWSTLKEYYQTHVVSSEEALRTEPMILYNFSKCLGLSKRYDECIEICDLGIRIARTTGRCQFLACTLFNRGWALLQRNRAEDRDSAKFTLRQACCLANIMGNQKETTTFCKFYQETYSQNPLI